MLGRVRRQSVRVELAGSQRRRVAPVLEGEPSTTSVVYYAPLLTLSLLLVTVAGVLAVVGVARLRRTAFRRAKVE